jgi:hypothetical protein
MKFEFTVGDEEEATLISDKRVSPEVSRHPPPYVPLK